MIWRRADGQPPTPAEWHDPAFRCLCVELRFSAESGNGVGAAPVFAVFNAGGEAKLTLPDTAPKWRLILDTTRPEAAEAPAVQGMTLPAGAVLVFTPDAGGARP